MKMRPHFPEDLARRVVKFVVNDLRSIEDGG